MVLVIMAAGLGSRFGGLKQIEPIGPNGEFIIDYSIYDAIKAGFKEVVFIIKKENYEIFRETIGKRIEDKIKVTYAFQEIKDTPIKVNFEREKPWGTGQAILVTKDIVKENFMVINADDFYGRDTFLVASKFLKGTNFKKSDFAMVGYKAGNTLAKKGSVKRGVCESKDNYLTSIIESLVEKTDNKLVATPLLGGNSFEIKPTDLVSMNAFAFTPYLFKYLKEEWLEFFKDEESLKKAEFLLPFIIEKLIKENKCTMKVLKTNAKWYGITYKEDKEDVVKAINSLIKKTEYPFNLWK